MSTGRLLVGLVIVASFVVGCSGGDAASNTDGKIQTNLKPIHPPHAVGSGGVGGSATGGTAGGTAGTAQAQ